MSERNSDFGGFEETHSRNDSSRPGFTDFPAGHDMPMENGFGSFGGFDGGESRPKQTESFAAPSFQESVGGQGFSPPGFGPVDSYPTQSPPQTQANSSWGSGFGESFGSNTLPESPSTSIAQRSGPPPAVAFQQTSAPTYVLLPSIVMGVVSIILSMILTFGGFTPTEALYRVLSVVAWLAAGIFGVTLLGLYFNADNRRRASGFYSILGWKTAVYWGTIALLILGILWSAVEIGQWVGKL